MQHMGNTQRHQGAHMDGISMKRAQALASHLAASPSSSPNVRDIGELDLESMSKAELVSLLRELSNVNPEERFSEAEVLKRSHYKVSQYAMLNPLRQPLTSWCCSSFSICPRGGTIMTNLDTSTTVCLYCVRSFKAFHSDRFGGAVSGVLQLFRYRYALLLAARFEVPAALSFLNPLPHVWRKQRCFFVNTRLRV